MAQSVDLNKLISYDLQIVFDPLKLALSAKADASALTALSAEVSAMRAEQASLASQFAMLKQLLQSNAAPGTDMTGALDMAGKFAAFEAEVRAALDAQAKARPDVDGILARLAALESRPAAAAPVAAAPAPAANGGLDELTERVSSLETEMSRILAELSATLAGDKSSSAAAARPRSAAPTAVSAPAPASAPASAPAAAASSSVSATPATATTATAAASAPAAAATTASATAAAVSVASTAVDATPSVVTEGSQTVPSPVPAVVTEGSQTQPSPVPVVVTEGSQTQSNAAVTEGSQTLPMVSSPVPAVSSPVPLASARMPRPGSGAFRRDGTEIPDWGVEIRMLGDRLQSMVSQLVPASENASSARSSAESALAQAKQAEAAMASARAEMDQRFAQLEAQLRAAHGSHAVPPPAAAPAPAHAPAPAPAAAGPSVSASDIDALRAELAALRAVVDALKAAPPAPAVVVPEPVAVALAPVEGEDPALAALRAEVANLSSRAAAAAKKQQDDVSSLRATDAETTARMTALQHALDGLRSSQQHHSATPVISGDASIDHAALKSVQAQLDALLGRADASDSNVSKLREEQAALAEALHKLRASGSHPAAAAGSGHADEHVVAWISAATAALQSLSGVEVAAGGKLDGDSLRKLTGMMQELAASGKVAASAFEVRGLQGNVRAHDGRLADLEGRLHSLQETVTTLSSKHGEDGAAASAAQLAELQKLIVELQEGKVSKSELDERLNALQASLAAVTKRVNEWIRKLSEALAKQGLSGSPTKDFSERAAASHKQLLKGFNCLSCDQPLRNLDTDRGAAVPGPALTQSTSTNKSFVFAQTTRTANGADGEPLMLDGAGATAGSSNLGATASAQASSFVALANGHVLQRPATAGTLGKTRARSPTTTLPRISGLDGGGTRTFEQGRPVSVVNRRGSGIFMGAGMVSVGAAASTVVDARSGSPVPHVYLQQ